MSEALGGASKSSECATGGMDGWWPRTPVEHAITQHQSACKQSACNQSACNHSACNHSRTPVELFSCDSSSLEAAEFLEVVRAAERGLTYPGARESGSQSEGTPLWEEV